VVVVAALIAALVGCRFDEDGVRVDGSLGPCPGYVCQCEDEERCATTCPFDGCLLSCERLGDCEASCGDGCATSSVSVRSLELECGDDCTADCASSGTCGITCGRNCQVTCRDIGTCSVVMEQGVVWCLRAGQCDVWCADGAGAVSAAEVGADGALRCGALPPVD
jgi:hypothetical protein